MLLLQIQFPSFVLSAITAHPIELSESRKSHRRFPKGEESGSPLHLPQFRSKSQNEENVPPIGHVSIYRLPSGLLTPQENASTDTSQPHSTTSIIY